MSGPTKKPTKLKILEGNPGKRQLPREPEPKPAMPSCPSHLKGVAAKEWKRITPELYVLGLLTQIDRAALAAYCAAYGRWVDAEREIARLRRSDRDISKLQKKYPGKNLLRATGLVRETSNGNFIMEPLISVSNKAVEQMHKFLVEFGMTPAARARISTEGKKDPDDPMEELLSGTRNN